MRNETLRRALAGKLWYIHEQKMNEMVAFLELRLSGGASAPDVLADIRAAKFARKAREAELLTIRSFDDEPLEPRAARSSTISKSGGGAVAVIPVYGMIMHRGGMDISGPSSTSTEGLLAQLRAAVNDPNVKAIVLDVDSPGGDVDGVDELATEIYQARKQKKISAVSNCLCASAAYYLASQASDLAVSPSSLTGSIGVYTMHEDDSKYLDDMGVKLTLIKFGENKAEGNNIEPLSDSAFAHLQEMVNTFGNQFEKAVARGRGIKQDLVHNKFGQGRVFDAKTAVKLGMADRVATLDEVLQGYGVSRNPGASASAGIGHKSKSDVGDPDDDIDDKGDDLPSDCACACEECKGGSCKACSCEDCACVGCACDGAASARKNKRARERRRLEMAAF